MSSCEYVWVSVAVDFNTYFIAFNPLTWFDKSQSDIIKT